MNIGGGRHAAHGSTSSASSTAPQSSLAELTDAAGGSRSSPSGGQRKERGAIAAQACDTCRNRKQKCDEQRPKCGTCQKFKLECHYREPQPTKKDKTLGEILDRLKSLESKIDILGLRSTLGPTLFTAAAADSSNASELLLDAVNAAALGSEPGITIPDGPPSSATAGASYAYRYSPAVYQMLGWPMVQQLLAPLEQRLPQLKSLSVEHDALGIVLGLHHPKHRLPNDTVTTSMAAAAAAAVAAATVASTGGGISTPAGFYPSTPVSINAGPLSNPDPLSWDGLYRLSNAYFDKFNFIAPIVDRQTFLVSTLPTVFNDGFDDSASTTLAFLVFALGDVAIAGVQGAPVAMYNGRPSGVKGGTMSHPPGLAFFNEARKRMGFVLSDCSLENIQIYALAGIYCSTCLRHMEYWRFTTTASLSCQALITRHVSASKEDCRFFAFTANISLLSKPFELTSPRADLIRRVFWYCLIIETHFHIELGLPLTGLDRFEDIVGLPDFSGPCSQDDYLANQASHFQEHFASQIVLRRLCVAFHNTLSSANLSGTASHGGSGGLESTPTIGLEPAGTAPGADAASSFSFPAAVSQMALQLEGWRGMLPQHLRWQESRPAEFPSAAAPDAYGQPMFPPTAAAALGVHASSSSSSSSAWSTATTTSSAVSSAMFSADLDAPPVEYPFALDLQVAILRTRYCYSKYLISRPFLYKALHHPEQLSREDAVGAAACLQACLRWPITMSPTCAHKRLVPCLFFWTQSLLGVLVVLRLAQQLPILLRIKATLCGGERFEREARETIALCVAWIRDLRGVDRAAEWAWEIVKGIYHLEE